MAGPSPVPEHDDEDADREHDREQRQLPAEVPERELVARLRAHVVAVLVQRLRHPQVEDQDATDGRTLGTPERDPSHELEGGLRAGPVLAEQGVAA